MISSASLPPLRHSRPLAPTDPIAGEQPSRSWPPELLAASAHDREQLRAESLLQYRMRRLLRRFALLVNRMAARLES